MKKIPYKQFLNRLVIFRSEMTRAKYKTFNKRILFQYTLKSKEDDLDVVKLMSTVNVSF